MLTMQYLDDAELAEMLDYVIKEDSQRQQMVDAAYKSVKAGETSEHRAKELVDIIATRR
jgi:spore maturation protein CgeB